MFGIKFRTWMESHIVRPRKKRRSNKDGSNGTAETNSKESNGKLQSGNAKLLDSAGNSPTSPAIRSNENTAQVFHCNFTSPTSPSADGGSTMEAITLSTANHHGYATTCNNLSSPESAYSTGYSTDGTSPGAGGPFPPPEYYINIRTGTHYFLPNATSKPTSFASPQNATPPPKNTLNCVHFAENMSPNLSRSVHKSSNCHYNSNAVVLSSQTKKYHLHPSGFEAVYNQNSPTARKTSPKVVHASDHAYAPSHRRTESCGESRSFPLAAPRPVDPAPPRTASPRQRTHIRTNPWLSSNAANTVTAGSFKNRNATIESNTSSSSGFTKGVCESSSSHGSCSDKASPQLDRNSVCSSSTASSCHSNASDVTDDDLTLNEMMGKFDESYIYEKETDILSDSDPTDCEETDFETGQEGGDERDTQDEEEFDFIDKGSLIDLPFAATNDNAASGINKGSCTYHDFSRKPRYRDSVSNRMSGRGQDDTGSPALKRASSRKDHSSSRKSARDSNKFNSAHSSQSNSKSSNEKKRTRNSVRKSARERNLQSKNRFDNNLPLFNEKMNLGEIGSGGVLNLNRILMQKMLSRDNAIGTRSAGNTPLSSRKNVSANNINSPKKTSTNHSSTFLNINGEREVDLSNESLHKRRSNSVCYVRSTEERNNTCLKTMCLRSDFSSELALIEADKEADIKYKQLILEAENILTTMKDQTPVKAFKHPTVKPNFFTRKMDFETDNAMLKLERNNFSTTKSYVQRVCTPVENVSPVHRVESLCNSPRGRRNSFKVVHDEGKRESDSDGSVTPLQEDLDNNPLEELETFLVNVQIETSCNTDYHRETVAKPRADLRYVARPENGQCRNGQERRCPREMNINEKISRTSPLVSKRLYDVGNIDQEKIEKRELGNRSNVYLNTSPMVKRKLHLMKLPDTNDVLVSKVPVTRCQLDEGGLLERRGSHEFTTEQRKMSKMVKSPTLANVKRPPLVAFRSVDLGNELDGSSYCPQSEPVKRKVYTCSATFDRLQKSLAEKSQSQLGKLIQKPEYIEDDSRHALREKLERLRRIRDEKESIQINEIGPNPNHQRQLSSIRRQMLVNTIEGLKRNLEDQSAKLKATYCATLTNKTNEIHREKS